MLRPFTVQAGKTSFRNGPLPSGLIVCRSDDKAGWFGYFKEESKYLIGESSPGHVDRDQLDWMKFRGRTYSDSLAKLAFANPKDNLFGRPVNPKANTFMCGFRWNPALNIHQLTFYNHVDGGTSYNYPIINVPLQTRFAYWQIPDYDRNRIDCYIRVFDGRQAVYHITEVTEKLGRLSRDVGPWAGGGDSDGDGDGGRAPSKVTVWLEKVEFWDSINQPVLDYNDAN